MIEVISSSFTSILFVFLRKYWHLWMNLSLCIITVLMMSVCWRPVIMHRIRSISTTGSLTVSVLSDLLLLFVCSCDYLCVSFDMFLHCIFHKETILITSIFAWQHFLCCDLWHFVYSYWYAGGFTASVNLLATCIIS